jgi:RNA polymerase sigma-70 factor (ECF subfamily)
MGSEVNDRTQSLLRILPDAALEYGILPETQPITLLLQDLARGDKRALDRLVLLLYPELRNLARGYLRNERPGHTLQPTALVHEAYARLIKQEQPDYHSRTHFMGVAAQVMRQILIDHARTRNAEKRGAGASKVPFDQAVGVAVERPSIMIAIDDALAELARKDPIKARLVEMRFFGGMTAEDSAEVLEIPVAAVRRHLRVGQAWLQRELEQTAEPEKKT